VSLRQDTYRNGTRGTGGIKELTTEAQHTDKWHIREERPLVPRVRMVIDDVGKANRSRKNEAAE
jgi:hypothetical protein